MGNNNLAPEQLDTVILRMAGDATLKDGVLPNIEGKGILDVLQENYPQVTLNDIEDSFEILENHGYIRFDRYPKNPVMFFEEIGFEAYLQQFYPDYDSLENRTCTQIVQNEALNDALIAQALSTPRIIIQHILKNLASRGEIKIDSSLQGIHITHVNASLRRKFKG
ncbi:MAG: hypothetical protein E3J71_05080 [Candidatus Stahlbacteria bacterium]|nr:MAG: hypothetical protein E3J71_05080 [Candidatus Stahlbacteria bacterium]